MLRVINRLAAAAACAALIGVLGGCGRVGLGSAGGDNSGWGWDVMLDDSVPVGAFLDDEGAPIAEGAAVTVARPVDDFAPVSTDGPTGNIVGIGEVDGWEVGEWSQQPPGEAVWHCVGVNDPNGGGDAPCGQNGKSSELRFGLLVRTFCQSGDDPRWAVLTLESGLAGLMVTTTDGRQHIGTDPDGLGLIGIAGTGELDSGAFQTIGGAAYAVDVAGSCVTGPG